MQDWPWVTKSSKIRHCQVFTTLTISIQTWVPSASAWVPCANSPHLTPVVCLMLAASFLLLLGKRVSGCKQFSFPKPWGVLTSIIVMDDRGKAAESLPHTDTAWPPLMITTPAFWCPVFQGTFSRIFFFFFLSVNVIFSSVRFSEQTCMPFSLPWVDLAEKTPGIYSGSDVMRAGHLKPPSAIKQFPVA